jgi:hypothetical protein
VAQNQKNALGEVVSQSAGGLVATPSRSLCDFWEKETTRGDSVEKHKMVTKSVVHVGEDRQVEDYLVPSHLPESSGESPNEQNLSTTNVDRVSNSQGHIISLLVGQFYLPLGLFLVPI